MREAERIYASFRDPAGFVFRNNGVLYRQINRVYADSYERAKASGLFDLAEGKFWLLPFREVQLKPAHQSSAYKIIRPEELPFISYPYEWSFSQIKDAALLTLDIHLAALEKDMLLKDASIYNVQFYRGRPIFIDHLSFDRLNKYRAWPAYGQFCRHFLAPLALMAMVDARLSQMYRVFLDGIPLDLATSMLPARSKLRAGLLMHLHLHGTAQKRLGGTNLKGRKTRTLGVRYLSAIAASVRKTIDKLKWDFSGTEWADYYQKTNYDKKSMAFKEQVVLEAVRRVSPKCIWDIGANTGRMSRICEQECHRVISFDMDHAAVEKSYIQSRAREETGILPLVMDFTNPSPSLGFGGRERESISERATADLVLALALIHHLVITNNLPLDYVADYFSQLAEWLLIEFVPKEDSQVQVMLATREDIFADYSRATFEKSFARLFHVVKVWPVVGSDRILYLMKKR